MTKSFKSSCHESTGLTVSVMLKGLSCLAEFSEGKTVHSNVSQKQQCSHASGSFPATQKLVRFKSRTLPKLFLAPVEPAVSC